jgi:hypothetical protein
MGLALDEEEGNGLLNRETGHKTSFKPMTGSLAKFEQMRLKKLIYRVSRGMAWVEFFEIDEKIDDYYGEEQDLCIYFIIYPAGIQSLKAKLEKICDSFNGYTMDFPG